MSDFIDGQLEANLLNARLARNPDLVDELDGVVTGGSSNLDPERIVKRGKGLLDFFSRGSKETTPEKQYTYSPEEDEYFDSLGSFNPD